MTTEEYVGIDNLEIMEQAKNYNAFLERLVLQIIGDSSTVIDFGAGIGTFARRLRERGLSPIAVEPDAAMLGQLRADGFVAIERVGQLEPESVDAAYTLNVIEHIEDDVAALKEIKRALRENGLLLVYVPAFMMLYGPMDRRIGHYRRYTISSLREALNQAGLHVREIRYADSIGFLAQLWLKYLGSSNGSISSRAVAFYDRAIFPVSRAIDFVASPLFGKNVYAVCEKPPRKRG